ncbi:MAG: hypothetical protein ABIG11_05185 [bacterium]
MRINKRLLLFCAILLLAQIFPGRALALEDRKLDFGRKDSHLHAAVAFAGTTVMTEFFIWRGYAPLKSCVYSSLLMSAAMVFKEVGMDKFASGNDLAAGGLGMLGAIGFQYKVRF